MSVGAYALLLVSCDDALRVCRTSFVRGAAAANTGAAIRQSA
jgi:hypothetical protein